MLKPNFIQVASGEFLGIQLPDNWSSMLNHELHTFVEDNINVRHEDAETIDTINSIVAHAVSLEEMFNLGVNYASQRSE